MVSIRHEPKTLGHLAERNRESFGRYELEAKEQELASKTRKKKEKPEIPWWRDSEKIDKSLANLNKKQQEEYILTGKKPSPS